MKNTLPLFRAVKGRVYHASDGPVRADHVQAEVVAICGARFERWYVFEPTGPMPTCPGCVRVLYERAIAAAAQTSR